MKTKLMIALIILGTFLSGLAFAGKIGTSTASCTSCEACAETKSCSSSCDQKCSK